MNYFFKKFFFLVFLSLTFFALPSLDLARASQAGMGQESEADAVSLQDGDSDAIAVRIIPNPENYNIQQWYRMQGFSGSPQSMIVDGYKAIRDGRTVYVSATNLNLDGNKLYFNIYLISYNQEADDHTVDIFGRILKNWKLNTNIKDRIGHCNISTKVCESDSDCLSGYVCGGYSSQTDNLLEAQSGDTKIGLDYQRNRCILSEDDYDNPVNTPPCMLDTDCPSNLFCDSLQSALIRDVERLEKLAVINSRLESYKKLNGHYPIISSGTYVPYVAVSSWPSWQSIFLNQIGASNISDPVNRIGSCYDPKEKFDLLTCWEESKAVFVDTKNPINFSNFALPEYSTVFSYVSDPNGESASVHTSMETSIYLGEDFELPSGDFLSDANPDYIDGPDSGSASYNNPYFVSAELSGYSGKAFEGHIRAKDPKNKKLSWAFSNCIPDAPLYLGEGKTTNCPSNDWSKWSPAKLPLYQTTNSNEKVLLKADKTGSSLKIDVPSEVEKIKEYIIGASIKNSSGRETIMNFPIYVANSNPLIQNNDSYAHNLSSYQSFSFDILVSDQSGLQKLSLCQLNDSNDCQVEWDLLSKGSGFIDFSGSSLFDNKLIIEFAKDSGGESYEIKIKNKNIPYTGNFKASHLGSHKFRIVADDGYDARTQKDFTVNFTADSPKVLLSCPFSVLLNSNYECVLNSEKPNETLSVKVNNKPSFLNYNVENRTFSGKASEEGAQTIDVTITNEFGMSGDGVHTFNVYTKPKVETKSPVQSNIFHSSFNCQGEIISTGNNIEDGYVGCVANKAASSLDIASAAACSNNCSGALGLSTGIFNSQITDLDRNTKYYYRAFAINKAGVGHGDVKSFYTKAEYPSITMSEVKASSGGINLKANISDNGGANLITRGFFWSTSSSVTAPPPLCNLDNNCWFESGGSVGDYSKQIELSKFEENRTYHFRAFAVNRDNNEPNPRDSIGISNSQNFNIPVPPSVLTNDIGSVTHNSAASGGSITNPSSVEITECGVVYSSSADKPVISGLKVSTNSCSGDFISNISGLTKGTGYYLRAYILSSLGTFYGATKEFTTLLPVYTVSFNKNNANATGVTSSQLGKDGSTIQLSSNAFSLNNYSFAGWAESAEGVIKYLDRASYKIISNATLYAKWKSTTYSMTYNGNGNTGGVGPASTTHNSGESVTISSSNTLSKTNYTFNGWNTKADGTGASYSAGDRISSISSNMTFYAQWKLSVSYKVTFSKGNLMSGIIPTGTMNPQIFYQGTPAKLNKNGFSRTTYNFIGWMKGAFSSVTIKDEADYEPTSDTTLTAKWESNGSYLRFPDGDYRAVTKGSAVGELPSPFQLDFRGWYTEESCEGEKYTSETIYNKVGDTYLYPCTGIFINPPGGGDDPPGGGDDPTYLLTISAASAIHDEFALLEDGFESIVVNGQSCALNYSVCRMHINEGVNVIVKIYPNNKYLFDGFDQSISAICAGSSSTCNFTMESNLTLLVRLRNR